MDTVIIFVLILLVAGFLDKRARDRAVKQENLVGKLDEILDELKDINNNINPEVDHTND